MDLANNLQAIVTKLGVRNGLVHVFAPHATGVLVAREEHEILARLIRACISRIDTLSIH